MRSFVLSLAVALCAALAPPAFADVAPSADQHAFADLGVDAPSASIAHDVRYEHARGVVVALDNGHAAQLSEIAQWHTELVAGDNVTAAEHLAMNTIEPIVDREMILFESWPTRFGLTLFTITSGIFAYAIVLSVSSRPVRLNC